MEHTGFGNFVALLTVAVVVVAVFRRIKLPPILGYLCVGAVVGPHALQWFYIDTSLHLLGEIGVALLLFTIGLEFSINQFMAMRHTLLGLGGVQVLGGTLSGGLIAWWLGMSWQAAFVVGGALAMSSTAIVVKQLTDQLELQAPHGRLALGILLFQDLAAVPFLVMIPILAGGEGQTIGLPLLYALLKGLLAVLLILWLGAKVVRPLFHEVGASRSAELFTLTVLLVSLVAAWITSLLGLSLALGAFLAGMMLSETEYRHQIDVDIRPFRDVLLGLFFILVGATLDPRLLPELWPWICLLALGLMLGKGPLIALLAWLVGNRPESAMRTGIVLAHGGEFGFALLALALSTGLVSDHDIQPILAGAVISMLLAPILIRHNHTIALTLVGKPGEPIHREEEIAAAVDVMENHVIICGYGRIGQNMAHFLQGEQIEFLALDLDPVRIKAVWEAGEPVFFGNASHRQILLAAGLNRARALVITFNDPAATLRILHATRSLQEDLPILVRARDDTNLEQLQQAGATEVVPEALETSLMLATQLLLLLNVPHERVEQRIDAVRRDRYRLLHHLIHEAELPTDPESK